MKEFDFELKNVFTGVIPNKDVNKATTGLLQCHNLEPLGEDYVLHEFVIDMDTDDYSWGNA